MFHPANTNPPAATSKKTVRCAWCRVGPAVAVVTGHPICEGCLDFRTDGPDVDPDESGEVRTDWMSHVA